MYTYKCRDAYPHCIVYTYTYNKLQHHEHCAQLYILYIDVAESEYIDYCRARVPDNKSSALISPQLLI